jgi:hypothetical protein
MGETTNRIVTDAELTRLLAARDEASPGEWSEDGGHLFGDGDRGPIKLADFRLKEDAIFCELAHEWMPDVVAALREARLMIVELLRSSHWGTVQRVKSNASDKHDSRITRMGESLPSVARRILHALGETTE